MIAIDDVPKIFFSFRPDFSPSNSLINESMELMIECDFATFEFIMIAKINFDDSMQLHSNRCVNEIANQKQYASFRGNFV